MRPQTVLRCAVPNDYSDFQATLLSAGLTTETWFCPPQHLSYFNVDNIDDFFAECGLAVFSKQVGFPIEVFLCNQNSNYVQDPQKGKEAHKARMMCVDYFIRRDPSAYQQHCEAAAAIDFGRDLIVYATTST
ncbi:MAG: hypothetical protein AAF384_13495 [Pseudomonadota bacterium]